MGMGWNLEASVSVRDYPVLLLICKIHRQRKEGVKRQLQRLIDAFVSPSHLKKGSTLLLHNVDFTMHDGTLELFITWRYLVQFITECMVSKQIQRQD